MHPGPEPFHHAALRTDASTWGRPEEAAIPPVPTGGAEPVLSDRGVRAYAEPPVARRRFSLGATFLGWSVAAFFTIVFSGAAAIALGAPLFAMADLDAQGLASWAFAAYLVASFLAYVIGGYAAGRIALWDGVRHGLGTVAWAVLFALLALFVGATLVEDLSLAPSFPIDARALGATMLVGVVLVLAAMLGGSALGGMWGQRYHDRVHGIEPRRRLARTRGRPL